MKEDRNIDLIEGIIDLLRPWTLPEKRVRQRVSQVLDVMRYSLPSFYSPDIKHAGDLDVALRRVEGLLISAPAVLRFTLDPNHFHSFCQDVRAFREICVQVVRRGPGRHGNYDEVKALSAQAARELLSDFSEQKIVSSPSSAYRMIASLIYEAITGVNIDLKKACDRELKQERHPFDITVRV
jgi:hypothetical protein